MIPFLLVLRPSLAMEDDENRLPSKVLILLDASKSMELTDEYGDLSRWKNALRILDAPGVVSTLKRLAADKVEIAYYQGAEDLRQFDPQANPTGMRTDMANLDFNSDGVVWPKRRRPSPAM